MRQDYPDYEILVLDDNSTDRTYGKGGGDWPPGTPESGCCGAARCRRDGPGSPMPATSSPRQAKGSWLLFTDADTIHAPTMLSSAMAYAHEHKLSLVSGLPLQKTASFSQRVAVPAMYFVILCCMPLWWVQGARRPEARAWSSASSSSSLPRTITKWEGTRR